MVFHKIFTKFLRNFCEIFAQFLRNFYKIFAKCLQISQKFCKKFAKNRVKWFFAKFLRIFYEKPREESVNFSRIFCEYFANISQIFREFFANISRIFHEYFANFSQIFREYFANISRIFCDRPREESVSFTLLHNT